MKGYGQFCPVAQTLEVIGERWTLLLVRELMMGSTHFGDLRRGVPLMSRSVLTQRLRSLADAGVIEHVGDEYRLTQAGRELAPIVLECGRWGARWARRKLRNADVDVGLLMWDMRRRIDCSAIPEQPVLVQFELRGAPLGKERFFLDFKSGEVELCLTNPGRDVDLHVWTTPRTMAEVWLGDLRLADAIERGALRLEGPRPLVRAFPSWLQLSIVAAERRRAHPRA